MMAGVPHKLSEHIHKWDSAATSHHFNEGQRGIYIFPNFSYLSML